MNLAQRKNLNLLTWLFVLGALAWLGLRLQEGLGDIPAPPSSLPVAVVPTPGPLPVNLLTGRKDAVVQDWRADYRLVGTFQTYRSEGTNTVPDSQLAVLDNIRHRSQQIVRTGDRFDGIRVRDILPDRILLQKEDESLELLVERVPKGLAGTGSRSDGTPARSSGRFEDMPAIEITPYGKKVAEQQWVIQRSLILDYVEDLMADPLRAAQLVNSMQPDRIDGEVAGFRLSVQGERQFYESMGLRDGDTIRSVNSMQMRSAKRANYLIQEFMKERMSAVVLDIERDGAEEKLVYIVR